MKIKNTPNDRWIDKLKNIINSNSEIYVSIKSIDPSTFKYLKNEFISSKSFKLLLKEYEFQKQNDDWKMNIINYVQNIKYENFDNFNSIEQSNIVKQFHKFLNESKAQVRNLKTSYDDSYDGIFIVKNDDKIWCFTSFNELTEKELGINQLEPKPIRYDDDFESGIEEIEDFSEKFDNPVYTLDAKTIYLDTLSRYFDDNTPNFVYHYSLLHIFSNELDSILNLNEKDIEGNAVFKNSKIWNILFRFQKDGVLAAIDKLNKYNGCLIADSVGLGKTFSALAIIKYFESRNFRVLVICPKRLRSNWESFKNNYEHNILESDRFRYDILNHTDLIRTKGKSGEIDLSKLNRKNYDLIVIDEAHNFRNNNGYNKFKKIETIDDVVIIDDKNYKKRTAYTSLMEEFIKDGVNTRVLLLTATPINNRFNDLKHQIDLISKNEDDLFKNNGINSIQEVFKLTNKEFNKWRKLPLSNRTLNTFINNVDNRYFKLLDLISIARSREFIKKFYPQEEIGGFPSHLSPKDIYSSFKIPEQDIDFATFIYNLMTELTLAAYKPIFYLNQRLIEDLNIQHENRKINQFSLDSILDTPLNFDLSSDEMEMEEEMLFNEELGDDNLFDEEIFVNNPQELLDKAQGKITGQIQLLIVNLFKRLESSLHSFNLTLESFVNNAKKFKSFLMDEISFDDYCKVNKSLSNFTNFLKSKGFKINIDQDYFDISTALLDIEHDLKLYEQIKSYTKINVKDEKINSLIRTIESKISEPINENNKKIIVFTAFSDTANYIYENISEYFKNTYNLNSALVTGKSRKNNLEIKISQNEDILDYFSPISKQRKDLINKKQIDILICTDVISEGQNLQDCDYLINYDIHWNPVRIIQRFGRIDRIGSKNKYIQMVNFWPTENLEKYLGLVQRVKEKSMIASVSTTGENILANDQDDVELEYRNQQIRSIANGSFEETQNGDLNLTDLNLGEYKIDLNKYCNLHQKELINKPLGLYSCVSQKRNVEPGVIFLFKQLGGEEKVKPNALYPYSLLYLDMSGNIILQPEQYLSILKIFKDECFNVKELDLAAIKKFNDMTLSNTNMDEFMYLANKASEYLSDSSENESMMDKILNYSLDTNDDPNVKKPVLISYLVIN